MRRATPGACAPWRSAGSSAAGSSPPRPRRCRRSARPWSARSSRASSSPSTRTACARTGSPSRSRRGASSSTSTSPGPTPSSAAASSTRRASRWAGSLAREHPVDADLVIGVPESGVPAAVGYSQESGHPLRAGLRQERLRRPHLHPALADAAPARHPAQAQPAGAHDPRQAARRRRRLDRARQHPARADPDAARGRCRRGARADLVAARAVAVLLRHRLRDAGRAHRDRARGRGDPGLDRRRLARATSPRRA